MSVTIEELAVVMPVYNEEGIIAEVLTAWGGTLEALRIDYRMHVYDDGSTDASREIVRRAAGTNPRIVLHEQAHAGHGAAVLAGYRENAQAAWILQIDSDNELRPEGFAGMWVRRHDYDFMVGVRQGRRSSLLRALISLVSSATVRLFYGPGVSDANCPYRLMSAARFREAFFAVPGGAFAPNVLLSGYACREKMRILQLPLPYARRATGRSSLGSFAALIPAARSFLEAVRFSRRRCTIALPEKNSKI